MVNGICLTCFNPAECASFGHCINRFNSAVEEFHWGMERDFMEDDPWHDVDPPEW